MPDPAPSATIPFVAFFHRFTDLEKVAVQAACIAKAELGVELINGLALGCVVLDSPEVVAWLDGLVTEGALTSERKIAILTP